MNERLYMIDIWLKRFEKYIYIFYHSFQLHKIMTIKLTHTNSHFITTVASHFHVFSLPHNHHQNISNHNLHPHFQINHNTNQTIQITLLSTTQPLPWFSISQNHINTTTQLPLSQPPHHLKHNNLNHHHTDLVSRLFVFGSKGGRPAKETWKCCQSASKLQYQTTTPWPQPLCHSFCSSN